MKSRDRLKDLIPVIVELWYGEAARRYGADLKGRGTYAGYPAKQ